MVRRKLNTYRIAAYELKVSGLEAEFELRCEMEYRAPNISERQARAMMKDRLGLTRIPYSYRIEWEKVGEETYSMPLSEFLEHARLEKQTEIVSND